MSRGTCAARKQRQRRCTGQRGYSLSQKRISPLEPQEKDFVLSDCGLKNCTRCAIRCLLDDVSKRFDFLLSSLSLCLRVGGLTQFPSTLDFINSVVACQGGIAALAAVFTLFWDTAHRNLSIQLNNPHWSCRKWQGCDTAPSA